MNKESYSPSCSERATISEVRSRAHFGNGLPNRLLNHLSNCLLSLFEIPEGYQDESGFHFGAPPSARSARSSDLSESQKTFTDRACEAFGYTPTQAPPPEVIASFSAPKPARLC